jgi:hypothetical protein
VNYDQWEELFQPVTENWIELDELLAGEVPADYVWTIVEGDAGLCLLPGFHYVNRLAYRVTRVPWTLHPELEEVAMDTLPASVDPEPDVDEGGYNPYLGQYDDDS